jgi:hypothetical protein
MECNICIEVKKDEKMFKCFGCKYTNCIDCHKTYLLSSINDPHCINCRTIIQYDYFLQKFDKKWVFNQYKKHKYSILWEREQSLIPQTVHFISLKKQEKVLNNKKDELYKEIEKLNLEISYLKLSSNNSIKKKFQYTYSCPIENCKGFLNEEFICEICDSTICKKCYIKVEKDELKNHECNSELVETFNTIKKEAKPCPTCGEFISKISGCDQMFCIKCGSAFSWKTGLIEKGIIHNPHAHIFFQNNPDAQQNYLNNINNNGCRTHIPHFQLFINSFFTEKNYKLLSIIHRKITEFRQYTRDRCLNYLQNNNEKNQDLRERYINNDITEKKLKETLHARDKKNNFTRNIVQTILHSYEIAEILLWNIVDCIPKNNNINDINSDNKINIMTNIEKNIELLFQLRSDTNTNLKNISDDFKYISKYKINDEFGLTTFLNV